jgi:hypothetical protein
MYKKDGRWPCIAGYHGLQLRMQMFVCEKRWEWPVLSGSLIFEEPPVLDIWEKSESKNWLVRGILKNRITELSVQGISKTSKNCRFSWKSRRFFDNWFFPGYLSFKLFASLELKAGITEIVFIEWELLVRYLYIRSENLKEP